ncbi:hypothetical protein GLOIN_2v1485279 [Rhizophagus irregularis DAOM 181602=DAOM 197198]|uniref:Uncharacterized protein n=1 Tax=Rhizophagus irregularis (strain DAOM 181602 / DAOM 197198 / MUCL 43194) TaxID=747089 RepID=U9SJZ8_RHIID|nr:hypothetical protein GLOIN_2v1485279 [Rhizophagus irregularis DAOM 181602=DAOM 197198]POG62660.1 hypothetical protein GLOIN_2v1485279 [Rhizophagus irregularis DAOM 181602=DAOM 197198]GBC20968.1 hypothetical protein GLOIN_2v1485279 [Rhizophagus irregularis DAOM 181602=DAOM 197198]|eukprot:XP_025169526.1 hypothetical protein GLOIN_2v1485279 [Rhizophagus irregularis DAOM 181602=DAOM 197198]
MSGRESSMSENEHRRSDDPSCHYMGCSCSLLHNQHCQTFKVFDFSRSAGEMVISTFKPVGEVDIDFRANSSESAPEPANQRQNMADNNKCGMKIKVPENHKDLVQSVANREGEYQKTNIKYASGNRFNTPSSLSLGCEWEFGRESRALAVWELCQNEHIFPSSITETRATNQNLCNNNIDIKGESSLLELQNDHEIQHTQDLPSLLRVLKNKQPYRDESNKNVLAEVEIQLITDMYGITDFCLVLACEDSVFWLEDFSSGAIYFWSRIDDTMIRGGDNLEEALINYLYHQDNLYYVDENTFKLIPIHAFDKEAEEWAKSPEAYLDIDVIKASLKHELNSIGEKKKHQKKQKKKKSKKKH